jgi:hypothetical protein
MRVWGKLGWLGLVLLIALGCRSTAPNLKPAKMPEVASAPPNEPRYNSPGYPKEAFRDKTQSPFQNLNDYKQQQVMPARGISSMGMGGY